MRATAAGRALVASVALAILSSCAAVEYQGSIAAASARDPVVEIVFMDVGQGDAALVTSPTGKKILVDAGPAARVVADRLRAMHVDTLDLVVATHNHADHIGGMAALITSVVVRNYLENGLPQATKTYERTVDALEARGVPVLAPARRRIDVGGGAYIDVLLGPPEVATQNERSVGLVLHYGRFTALFTGDAEEAERGFWRDSGIERAVVLKVSHHGGVNGTDGAFLDAVQPCVAIISVGERNAFGHPASAVLDVLKQRAIAAYRTDESGDITVVVRPDGAATVTTSRGLTSRRTDKIPVPCRQPTHSFR